MPLVQAPGVLHGNPHAVHFFKHRPQRLYGTAEYRGVGDVEAVTLRGEQLAGGLGFALTFGGQADIGPAGKAVFLIPDGFAMAHEDDFVHEGVPE